MSTTEVFFEDQRKVIIDCISKAKSSIIVAMELFTDNTLFDLLVKKAQEGVRVQLMVRDDEINIMTGINYAVLKDLKGDFSYKKNLHNKFCIIDSSIVLTGSCNWTYDGIKKHVDLVLINDDKHIPLLYQTVFYSIKNPEYRNRIPIRYASAREERIKRRSERLHKKQISEETKENSNLSEQTKSSIMGILDYLREGDDPGIIEETVFHIIAPIKEYGVTSVANETEVMSLFFFLLGQRAQAAMFVGQTKGNLLLDTGIDKIYQYYQEGFGKQFLSSMKLDLPLFVFTAMYLENPDFRNALKEADELLKKEVFDTIHLICEHFHFYLVQYPDLMCRENLKVFHSYLQKKGLT